MDEHIRQNLLDAGCDEEFIGRFDSCICDERACKKLLAAHRRGLLDEIHEKERELDCLDYLVFMMDKKTADRKERQL